MFQVQNIHQAFLFFFHIKVRLLKQHMFKDGLPVEVTLNKQERGHLQQVKVDVKNLKRDQRHLYDKLVRSN